MVRAPDMLPEDVAALHELIAVQTQRHRAEVKRYEAELEHLRAQLRLLVAKRYGSSSERVDSGQLGLFNEAEVLEGDEATSEPEPESTTQVPAHTRRRRGGRSALPEELPRVEVVHALSEAEAVCPHDGTALEVFGEETSEQLDIVPAEVQVLHHRRLKYRCPCCAGHVCTAPMTPQPLPKSQASPGLLAWLATGKYVDGLPLHRLGKLLGRIGVEVPTQTLARWMVRSGTEVVQALINLLHERQLAAPYLQMDETTVQVLKEPGKAAESTSYMWVRRSAGPMPIVLFDYDPTRSGEVPRRLLEGFTGTVQTDGYEGYAGVVQAQGLKHLGCFAHARRYFTDGLVSLGLNPKKLPAKPPPKAKRLLKGLGFIQTLYIIERRIRDNPPDERYRVRQAESVPVLEKLREWVQEQKPKVLPSSALGKALHYLEHQWPRLIGYCDDGHYEIDNNLAENAIRPFVLGRKGWLFSDSVAGARASANLYSLIETAKANGHEPYGYLRRVFTELPQATCVEDIEALLPLPAHSANLAH